MTIKQSDNKTCLECDKYILAGRAVQQYDSDNSPAEVDYYCLGCYYQLYDH